MVTRFIQGRAFHLKSVQNGSRDTVTHFTSWAKLGWFFGPYSFGPMKSLTLYKTKLNKLLQQYLRCLSTVLNCMY